MAKYNVEFDYFHDYESEQFAFYRIPKVLFTDDYFRNLSSDAIRFYVKCLEGKGMKRWKVYMVVIIVHSILVCKVVLE